jgi:Protein of unknown function DUF262/Protein of unknown function (DUF1524)
VQPSRQTVHQVFDISRRLVVPLYQRAYIWEKEKHWEPFFQDIRAQARNCFYAIEGAGHFLGPIVTQAEMVSGGAHPRYNIIDGQQRLTTFEIFVKALHLIASKENHWASGEFERLFRNPARAHVGAEEVYKVWPTNSDRHSFQQVMELKDLEEAGDKLKNSSSALTNAYMYFQENLMAFLKGREDDVPDEEFSRAPIDRRIESIHQALTSKLYFIVLELESGDDPQIIFETLNARGEPLLPSDLIRNDLFLKALRERLNADFIYRKYWADFEERRITDGESEETRFWHVMDTQGRLYRPRIDLFVFHWLTMKRAIAKHHDELLIANLYREFKKWTSRQQLSAEQIFADLATNRDNYARLIEPIGKDRVSTTAERLNAIDTGTVHPLLLFLVGKYVDDLSNADLERTLNTLESYLIRRLLTRSTTKNYNRTFLSLLTKVANADAGVPLADLVESELLSLKGPTVEWPNDEKLRSSILDLPIYVRSRQDRVRMILIAVENHIRSQSGSRIEEPLANPALSIEHLLPQEATLEDYPYAADTAAYSLQDEKIEEARERLLHTLGNLTLLTQPLNSSISNGSFSKKRAEITEHSVLRLNRFLSGESAPSMWDENSIVQRGQKLYEHIRAIWPRPEKEGQHAEATKDGNDTHMEAKRAAIIKALSQREGVNLIPKTGVQYQSTDGRLRVVFSISKRHERGRGPYWYGYSDHWREFLEAAEAAFFVFGCMDRDSAYAIPFSKIDGLRGKLYRTPDRHWHIDLEENSAKELVLALPDGSKVPLREFELKLPKSS